MIRQIDDAVAELMTHVSLEDTVVFFTSDHGDYGGHRGLLGKVPWIPFDDLAKVPFFCVGARVEGGRRIAAPVQSCDFALTCLELAGLEPPAPADPFDTDEPRQRPPGRAGGRGPRGVLRFQHGLADDPQAQPQAHLALERRAGALRSRARIPERPGTSPATTRPWPESSRSTCTCRRSVRRSTYGCTGRPASRLSRRSADTTRP